MATQTPLCFVLMPFGSKPDPTGRPDIDFDRIYAASIEPAIRKAEMTPIRADEERIGGIIHKPMFERLLLCEYAVADLTTANANVFYELGVRHTARPATTQTIFAEHQPIPFDVNFLRGLPYDLGPENCFSDDQAEALREALARSLVELRERARSGAVDSPVFQLLEDWSPGALPHEKTDIFRDQVQTHEELKARMAAARRADDGTEQLKKIQDELGNPDVQEVGILVDLMLSYRGRKAWDEMIQLYEIMPAALKRQVMVREQWAFALNRRAAQRGQPADRDRALQILKKVEAQQGANPETCGLIGRIYKDLWEEATRDGSREARRCLSRAIEAYRRGFDADWRDAYPGINAVTLLDIRGDERSRVERDRLLPVVRYAVERRLESKQPDYWDHATMLELAVLASDREAARRHLDAALDSVRELFEPETTARNLRLIREARASRGESMDWLDDVIRELDDAGVA